jgi:hypothetical protein
MTGPAAVFCYLSWGEGGRGMICTMMEAAKGKPSRHALSGGKGGGRRSQRDCYRLNSNE